MKKNGLSIPEVMIAIFIILVGLSGISGVISKIIPVAGLSSLYFEASYLAQEGIELVRNKRDENWINFRAWNDGITSSTQSIPPFTRTVTVIEPPDAPPDTTILITAEVTFDFKGKTHNFSAQEYIYQWIR